MRKSKQIYICIFCAYLKYFAHKKRVREQVLGHLFVGNNMAREIKLANELICKLKSVKNVPASNLVSTFSSDHSNVLVASGGHTEVSLLFHEKTLVSRFQCYQQDFINSNNHWRFE